MEKKKLMHRYELDPTEVQAKIEAFGEMLWRPYVLAVFKKDKSERQTRMHSRASEERCFVQALGFILICFKTTIPKIKMPNSDFIFITRINYMTIAESTKMMHQLIR